MCLIITYFLIFCTIVNLSICTKEYKVIIVGAGASGIAAATKLLENDVNDILVLEAESRIGGRINTVNFDGTIIELGAEWCHGEKNNIVYETLKEKNLLNLLHHDEMSTEMYLSSRQNISKELSDEISQFIMEAYYKDFDNITASESKALVGKWCNQEIAIRYGHNQEKFNIFKWSIDYLRHVEQCEEAAFSWDDCSFDLDFEDCEGYYELGWKNHGYRTFLDILMKKYPNPKEQLPIDDKILLNKEVTKILFNPNNVNISCSDNSTYVAKHVIFTPSLGVLKAKSSSIFGQILPSNKLLAIERLGMGSVIKVFLKYEKRWWGNSHGFNFIWTDNDKAASKQQFPDGPTNKNGESWIVDLYCINVEPGSNILAVWFTGELVPAIEMINEDILVKGIEFVIDKFLGHLFTIPKSQKMLRFSWYSNPNFQGTYSFSSINSTTADILNLQAPVNDVNGKPVLLFAGEATNPIHHATVHGAVESGYREANRLIQLFKKH